MSKVCKTEQSIYMECLLVSVLTTSSAPPQILAASTVFCPLQKRRNDGDGFLGYRCRFVLNSKRLLSTS